MVMTDVWGRADQLDAVQIGLTSHPDRVLSVLSTVVDARQNVAVEIDHSRCARRELGLGAVLEISGRPPDVRLRRALRRVRWRRVRSMTACSKVSRGVGAHGLAQIVSGSILIAPQGHSSTQIPQPLQKSRSKA